MILRRLLLEGFGRFRQREIVLEPGLNLLFGPNEAGKSTLHAFLDGMLCGFRATRTQAGRQRRHRAYTPDRERYRPWDGGSYAGALEYEHEDRVYLVRRDFARDQIAIQDALTGRDLTATFARDPATGEPDFARRHGGLTPLIFRNTVSVDQAVAGIDREGLAGEIREVLLRSDAPADGTDTRAIEALQGALAAIGTASRGKSPLGQAHGRVAALEERRRQALAALTLTRSLEDVQARLQDAQVASDAARARRDGLERNRGAARLREALAIEAEMETLANFPVEDPEALPRLQARSAAAERAQTTEDEALALRQQELADAEAAVPLLARLSVADLAAAREAWTRSEDLTQEAEQAQARAARLRELSAISDETLAVAQRLAAGSRAGLYPFAAGGGLLALVVGLALPSAILAVLGGVLAVLGISRMIVAWRSARRLADLLHRTGADDIAALARLDDERRVLRAQPAADPESLQRRAAEERGRSRALLAAGGIEPGDWEAIQAGVTQAQAALHAADLARARYREQRQRAEAATDAVVATRGELTEYLAAHGMPSPSAFAERTAAAARRRELAIRLDSLLAGTTVEALRRRFPEGPPPDVGAVTEEAVAAADAVWQERLTALPPLQAQEADLRQQLGPDPPALGEIEAELRVQQAELYRLEGRRAALELALTTLADLQEAMQREFAPVLHRRLGDLAPALTGGRYRELHVDEELHVTVRAPERADLVPAESLSRGTLDQIYLAARVALAEVATGGGQVPLLLDDTLAHFDDERLAEALACLAELARGRQILLFTCHARVARALCAASIAHNEVQV